MWPREAQALLAAVGRLCDRTRDSATAPFLRADVPSSAVAGTQGCTRCFSYYS